MNNSTRIADHGSKKCPLDTALDLRNKARAHLQLTTQETRIEDRGSHTTSTDPELEDRGSRARHNQDNRSAGQLEPDPGDRRPRAIQARSRAYTRDAPVQHGRPPRRAQANSHQAKKEGSEEPSRDRLETCLRTSPRTRNAPRDHPRHASHPGQAATPRARTTQPGHRLRALVHPRRARQSCPSDHPQWH